MTEAPVSRREMLAVLACCAAASLVAMLWSWHHDALLNYGDAEAHLHIARRVIDSHRPGLTQLGSVWLPLPHLLLIPFVAVFSWWRNGLAGLIPSALAWMFSCAGLYRLLRRWLKPEAAIIALAFFVFNPNLIYMQTTAMTEPLFVCEMIWTAKWLVDWRASLDNSNADRSNRLLWCIVAMLTAAVFTRYDGWIMELITWTAIGIVLLRRGMLRSRTYWIATAVAIAAPIVWFAYNQIVFGDWLDFARGPYSAKAIELNTTTAGSGPPHPGWHNPWVSLIFYVKAAEMDAAALAWGNFLLITSLLGTAWAWLVARRKAFSWTLILWLPVPFYAYSVAFGSVPIFLPVWWPHSFYNTRYGLEMLPAFAVGIGFVANFIFTALREINPKWVRAAAALLLTILVANAAVMMREGPPVFIEGTKNAIARRPYEQVMAAALRVQLAQHPGSDVLMETSVYPQVVALSGIPLRQTLNESDREYYQAALAAPAQHACIALSLAGDSIEKAVREHPQGLVQVGRFTAHGQPAATLYACDTPPSQHASARIAAVVASGKESVQ